MIEMLNIPQTQLPAPAPAFMLKLYNEKGDELTDITINISPRLISLTIADNRGLSADQMTLILDDSDHKIMMPTRGKQLVVYVGWEGSALVKLGEFNIDQVKHEGAPDRVTVIGRSVDFSEALNTRQESSWHDISLGSLVEAIAFRHGLQADVAPSIASIHIEHADQSQETDLSFLQRLAARYGLEVIARFNKLMLIYPGSGTTPQGASFSPVVITRSSGDRHSFELADRLSYTGVSARWLDTSKANKPLPQVKVSRKAGEDDNPAEYMAGKIGNVYVMSTLFSSKEIATKAAQSLWRKFQANAASFSITLANGRAELTPETPVRVSGFKEAIDQTPWVINKVTHTINSNGFITQLDLEIKLDETLYDVNADS
nr:contractile injection system protein, VgrG/Pvc8 family [Pluralibacter gergoviae]